MLPSPSSPVIPTADELLDALPWGVLVRDEPHLIRRVNQQLAHWCGTSPAALPGCPLAGASLPPAVKATLLQLLAPGRPATSPEVLLPQLGQWLTFSATRQPSGWLPCGQGITLQKQREQQY